MALKVIEFNIQSKEQYDTIVKLMSPFHGPDKVQDAIKAAGYYMPINELDSEKMLWILHLARQDNDPIYNEDILKVGIAIGQLLNQ